MNYDALFDYSHALLAHRDLLLAREEFEAADEFGRYADSIIIPANLLRMGEGIPTDRARGFLTDLLRLSSPARIEAHAPHHRQNVIYRAVMELATKMERVIAGKRANRWWEGILR